MRARGSDAAEFISRYRSADAAAADEDANVSFAALDGLPHFERVIRIIVRT